MSVAASSEICPECHLGRMGLKLVTYVRQFGGTLINVANTPTWECDVCHVRIYERSAVLRVEALVGQAGPPPNRHRPAPPKRAVELPDGERADSPLLPNKDH